MSMVKLIKNPCFIYTLFWCLYLCQGVLYPNDSIVSKSLAMFIALLSVFYTFRCIFSVRFNGYLKSLLAVLVLVISYGIIAFATDGKVINGLVSDTPVVLWIRNMCLSILPIFTYIYFAKSGYLTAEFVGKLVPIMVIAVLVSYYWSYQTAIATAYLRTGNDVEDVTNNAGYALLPMIPLLLVYDGRKTLQYIGLLLIVLLVVFSMKRGAILICAVMSALFVYRSFRHASFKSKLLILLLILAFFAAVYFFISDFMMEDEYFLSRLDDLKKGNSSGRDSIYSTLWTHFIEDESFFHFLFGGGIWYTTKICWTAAHNDWLEFLLDMGVFGVCIYVVYWMRFYKMSRSREIPDLSRFCILLLFIDLFMRTLFSMSLDSMTFIHAMMLGLSYYGLLDRSLR